VSPFTSASSLNPGSRIASAVPLAPASLPGPAVPLTSASPLAPAAPLMPVGPLTSGTGAGGDLPRIVTSLSLPALDLSNLRIPPVRPQPSPGPSAGPSADEDDSPIYEEMRAAAERRLPGYQEAMSRYLPPESQAAPATPARRPAPQGRQQASASRSGAARRPAPQNRPKTRPKSRQQTPPRKPPNRPATLASQSFRPAQSSRPSRPSASRPGGGSTGVKAVLILIAGVFALIVGRAVIGELTDHFGAGGSSATAEAPAPQLPGNPGGSGDGAGHKPRKTAGPIRTVFQIRTVQGSSMTVQLVRLLDPARPRSFLDDPGPGKHLVAAVFTVRGLRGATNDDAYNDAVLLGSDGKRYQWSFADLAGHHPSFTNGVFRLRPGIGATGTVTAVLPNGVRVVRVRWTASSGFGQAVTWHLRRPR
jgi:hypothetical protein